MNSVPPGSVTDFYESDKCDDVECDEDYENNEAYQGSYFEHFEGEPDILVPLTTLSTRQLISQMLIYLPILRMLPAPVLKITILNTTENWTTFTNKNWVEGTTRTHQNAWQISDHTPVSGVVILGDR